MRKVITTVSSYAVTTQFLVIVMRVCAKCGKANQETRKFCIRCGASLLAPVSKRGASAASGSPETGKVTTAATIAKAKAASAAAAEEELSTTTKDEWVRPSSVSRDRVRAGERTRGKSELEKAREAFARAEAVGVADEDTGIVETRMMRASEVRELLQSSAEESETPSAPIAPSESSEAAPSAASRVTRPAPPVVEERSERESRILGQKSAFVSPQREQAERVLQPPEPLAAAVRPAVGAAGSEFKSSRYEEETPAEEPAQTQEDAELQYEEPIVAETVEEATVEPAPTAPTPQSAYDIDRVTTCSKCGSVINIDMYDYPREVYSAMGNARLSQARFFIVQGKYPEAQEVLLIATSLFTKAEDKNGLTMVRRLVDSLQR